MTIGSLSPGRIVTGGDPVAPPPFLRQPETPQEHLRHVTMLLRLVIRDASGAVHMAGPDYDAALARLQQAIAQLEGRA